MKVNLKIISLDKLLYRIPKFIGFSIYLNDHRIFGIDPTGYDQQVYFNQDVELSEITEALKEFITIKKNDKMLKTLEEHNKENSTMKLNLNSNTPSKNGIACPVCGEELYDTKSHIQLLTYPPQYYIHCDCGYKGTRF